MSVAFEKQRQKKVMPVSPGRPKGVPNKMTTLLKEAILQAGENAGNRVGDRGLVSYLEQQAIEHPGPFMALLGKVLPLQIGADASMPLITEVRLVAVKPNQVEDD
jgi:hypothetical protein